MQTAKLVGGVLLGLLVGVGVGWLLGASGRDDVDRVVQAAQLRSYLLQARGSALAARVDIYNVNFGDASRDLETAKGALRRATDLLKTAARTGEATQVAAALTQLDEAQQMGGRLDQGANARTAAAVKTIDGVLETAAAR